jgi:hypothetical protein
MISLFGIFEAPPPSRSGPDEEREREGLPEGALSIGGVLKGIEDLLESHVIPVLLIEGLPHDAIRL